MAEQVILTKEEENASYPDLVDKNLVTSKIPLKRMNSTHGRVYYQSNAEVEDRAYLYSSTTILDNVLTKGIGFDRWLGNATSYSDAMEYAKERAMIGNMTLALALWLIWGETIDCRHGFFIEDSVNTQ